MLCHALPCLAPVNPCLLCHFKRCRLLPARTQALPYAGVHDFNALLELRATPVGEQPKVVALVQFNKRFAEITENMGGWASGAGGQEDHVQQARKGVMGRCVVDWPHAATP